MNDPGRRTTAVSRVQKQRGMLAYGIMIVTSASILLGEYRNRELSHLSYSSRVATCSCTQ